MADSLLLKSMLSKSIGFASKHRMPWPVWIRPSWRCPGCHTAILISSSRTQMQCLSSNPHRDSHSRICPLQGISVDLGPPGHFGNLECSQSLCWYFPISCPCSAKEENLDPAAIQDATLPIPSLLQVRLTLVSRHRHPGPAAHYRLSK